MQPLSCAEDGNDNGNKIVIVACCQQVLQIFIIEKRCSFLHTSQYRVIASGVYVLPHLETRLFISALVKKAIRFKSLDQPSEGYFGRGIESEIAVELSVSVSLRFV